MIDVIFGSFMGVMLSALCLYVGCTVKSWRFSWKIVALLAAIMISALIAYVIIGSAWSVYDAAERAQDGFFK